MNAIRKQPSIQGLTDMLETTADMRKAIVRLEKARLLECQQHGRNRTERLDTHALVQRYFKQELEEETVQHGEKPTVGFSSILARLQSPSPVASRTWTRSSGPVCACRGGRGAEALHDIYLLRIMRGEEYFAASQLGALNPLLIVLSQFFKDGDWAKPDVGLTDEDQRIVLTHAGWFLTATKSYAAQEVCQVFTRAEPLCKTEVALFPVLPESGCSGSSGPARGGGGPGPEMPGYRHRVRGRIFSWKPTWRWG